MAIQAVTVLEVIGQAWVRESDGSMVRLQEGDTEVSAHAEIITAEGASLQLQHSGQPPFEVGGGRALGLSAQWLQTDAEPADNALMPLDSDAAAILTAIQAGSEGSDDSGFASLVGLIDTTTPLGLEYPGSLASVDLGGAYLASSDRLDLADLLHGEFYSTSEGSVTDIGNLDQYLHFDEADGSTVISISSEGGFAEGLFDASKVDRVVTLDGVSLQEFAGNTQEQEQIIKNLIDQGKLNLDQSS